MRTQNDIDSRYHPKSFEEIKAEIQNPRKFGLTKTKKRKSNLNFQREERISVTGITQPKENEAPNPVLIFIIVVLVLALLSIPVVGFIALALFITALIYS